MTPYAVDLLKLLKMKLCSAAHEAPCGRSGGEFKNFRPNSSTTLENRQLTTIE